MVHSSGQPDTRSAEIGMTCGATSWTKITTSVAISGNFLLWLILEDFTMINARTDSSLVRECKHHHHHHHHLESNIAFPCVVVIVASLRLATIEFRLW